MKHLTYFVLSGLLTLSSANRMFGEVISSASISDPVAKTNPAQTVSGPFSATASVSSRSNTASAGASLSLGVSSLSTFTFSDTAAANVVSRSTASFDNFFVVTGGSGTGYFALTYNNQVTGFSDAQASANSALTVTENGATLYNSRVCSNVIGQVSSFSCNNQIPIGFAFTYGQPFALASSLASVAGGGLGGSTIGGTGSLSYVLLSSSGGQPVSGAVNLAPEPASWMLLLFGAGLFRVFLVSKRQISLGAARRSQS